MSVLVTGGAGYIGSHTVVELLNLGKNVVIVDNFYNSDKEVLKRIEQITGKRPKFYQEDVTDKAALINIFEQETIEAVIHFAGYKAVGESVQKPVEYYHNNLMSTIVLVEVMKMFGVKKLVFSSSATVYGMHHEVPFVENMSTSATNPYGYTKVMCEQILKDVSVSDNEWSIVLLRYFNPIGAHESGLIGEDPSGIPNNLMPYISQVAVGKLEHVNVFGNDYDTPDGTGVRDYIHIVDLAKGHVKALEKANTTKGTLIYNLGSGQGTSVLELIHTFMKVTKQDVPYIIGERRSGDIATCYADATRAWNDMQWKTEKTLEDMCRDTWRWQSQNPKGYAK
ncbi:MULTISPECIES: UDP-glucose 4-epimerase GalE [unclassified Granulicatella]|uniref:UDP-glucose 4-epimerase GalE n=1 Tax=unclassified Granulicatella TaxID=2630493 RepID=UPI0010743AEA|nr:MULTISPECIES: UDP-glucose 4-epimerase GalE [unclassified Granulicatella]MBF0781105.1 UDP-glucose 4-epimerase GalE [Granulicatella sp. 19428wC4_WM01]TFU92036.1 UDP-glucose 4-epimerase GalE [Granulicatella sp. WM01]